MGIRTGFTDSCQQLAGSPRDAVPRTVVNSVELASLPYAAPPDAHVSVIDAGRLSAVWHSRSYARTAVRSRLLSAPMDCATAAPFSTLVSVPPHETVSASQLIPGKHNDYPRLTGADRRTK